MRLHKWFFTCKLKDPKELKKSFEFMKIMLYIIVGAIIGGTAFGIWFMGLLFYLLENKMTWGDYTLWVLWVPVIISGFVIAKFTLCEQD